MDVNDREQSVLAVLADGRANPYLIREETGLSKGDVNTVLNRLGRNGYVEQITRGLYEITAKGESEVDDPRAEEDR
jgi:DNA-binding IclR family transcriptional regulator